MIGSGTVATDDPLLTARPPGARIAARVIADTHGSLASGSQLVKTARDVPVLVAVGEDAPAENRARLSAAGCEVLVCSGTSPADRLNQLLDELGRRRMTNVLVEGGSRLLGSLWDAQAIDEVHVFIASKLIGGGQAPSPLGGLGIDRLAEAGSIADPRIQHVGDDFYISGRLARPVTSE